MSNVQLSEFFENEYVDFSVYDNVRKIASYIDGQKNSSRKVLHTLREQNVTSFVKVSNLGPRIQDHTQYLHGSLEGVITNMTANYVGSGNNIPLLEGDGNFGSSFIPAPAATRYIFARQSPIIKDLFLKDDSPLLEEQWFEGDKIEPRYYVPVIPMLAINGSEGMSIGFAQKILPRNPRDVCDWVTKMSNGTKPRKPLIPYWTGQTFTVEPGETPAQWIIKGKFIRNTKNKLTITSIPVGYTLKSYQNVLDKLVDDKVIRNYDDLSDEDVFKFELNVDKGFSAKEDAFIMTKLKLVKTITENYTCIDENNKIVQFATFEDMIKAWYDVRIAYNAKRKDYILSTIENDIEALDVKRLFIGGVVDGLIELRNRGESEIERAAIECNSKLKSHIKSLINLPMRVLTKEEIKKLDSKIKDLKKEYKEYSKKSFEIILQEDVKNIESYL